MYFIAFLFGYMATFFINNYYCETCPLTYPHNNSVQIETLLFFNGLWAFVIKITSGFREALKWCVVDQCTQQPKFTTIP